MTVLNEDDFSVLDVIKYFTFLDDLRESGETNMFGAAPYLVGEFPELDFRGARSVLQGWADTFDDTDAEDRAYKALGKDD